MLRYFLKTPPLNKILQFQKKFAFLLKTQKTTSSASVWSGNNKFSFNENARTFSKSFTTQENTRISKPKKKAMKFVQKENFEPKIKSVITYKTSFINKTANK